MKYFKFHYIQVSGKEIIKQGEAVYYTGAETNLDEMKMIVREILKNNSAVVTIQNIIEIDEDTFNSIKEGA